MNEEKDDIRNKGHRLNFAFFEDYSTYSWLASQYSYSHLTFGLRGGPIESVLYHHHLSLHDVRPIMLTDGTGILLLLV